MLIQLLVHRLKLFRMSDSGSETSSDEDYNSRRSRAVTPDGSASSQSAPQSPSDRSMSSRGKSPDGAVARSPISGPASPKSQRSGPMSPKSPRSDPASPRSSRSSQKSMPISPKSYRSERNSPESPHSDQSFPGSLVGSVPASPKSPRSNQDRDSPKFVVFGQNSRRSAENSPKSPTSRNSTPNSARSKPTSPKSPGSPTYTRTSAKTSTSTRNSPKSLKSLSDNSFADDRDFAKSEERSPTSKTNAFIVLDGEQISDGDIDDEPEPISKSKPAPMTHGEDLSDVSDLDSLDGVDEPELQDRRISDEKKEEKNPAVTLVEESEQLDFEADGQWKDERDDGWYMLDSYNACQSSQRFYFGVPIFLSPYTICIEPRLDRQFFKMKCQKVR